MRSSVRLISFLIFFCCACFTFSSCQLKNGDKIQLVGFGTFEVAERAARTGQNPQTGKAIEIPASKAPKFKAGKALKDTVNSAK